MQLNDLKRNTKRMKAKQVGRGGTRGKTSGRGHKGQKQHGGHGIRPHMRDVIKKLPKLRGRGKNSNLSIQTKPSIINLKDIDTGFANGDKITPGVLAEKGLVKSMKGRALKVKVLGNGDITKKVSVEGCDVSESAKKKIADAGGNVVENKKVEDNK